MSADEYEAALSAFIAALKQARYAAGMPSYKNLQRLSEQALRHRRPDGAELLPLTKSTAHSMLSGRVVRPPRWQVVLTFVTVLHEAARKAGIDPARIGTVDEWKQRHEILCAAEQVARRPVPSRGKQTKPSPDPVAPLEAAVRWAYRGSGPRDFEEDIVFGEVLGLVRRTGGPQWWHCYHDVVPEWLEFYLYLESAASVVRVYATHEIPELLQVEAYARTMLSRRIPDAPEKEIARLAELRMNRQRVLRDRQSCRLWAIVEETAIRNQPVDRATMRAQIGYLIEAAQQWNITLQVRRDGVEDNVTIKEPMTIFRFPEPRLCDVACLEQPGGGLFPHGRNNTGHYLQLMSALAIRAATPNATIGLLQRMLADI